MIDSKAGKALALVSQLGINMIVPVFFMGWIGSLLDSRLSTQVFFPICLLLGIGGGFQSVYTIIKNFIKEEKKENEYHDTK